MTRLCSNAVKQPDLSIAFNGAPTAATKPQECNAKFCEPLETTVYNRYASEGS